MITGKLPYADIDDIDALKSAMCSLKQVNLPKEANKLPRGFRKALGAMLQVDPELRPSIDQVLILIKETDNSVSLSSVTTEDDFKVKKRLNQRTLPLPPLVAKTTQLNSQSHTTDPFLDENTRITLALIIVIIIVYDSIR